MTRKHDNNPKRTSNRPAKPKTSRANPPRPKRFGADPVGGDLGRPWASDDGSDVRQAAGFGIGLSIARSIAEGHRGAISARTEGDTITVTALLK